jgi:hypothetical protein
MSIKLVIGGNTIIDIVDNSAGYLTQPSGYVLFNAGSTGGTIQLADIAVTGVNVTPSNVSLYATETTQLKANILPSNATIQLVNWTTSNPTIATVNSVGLVTAVGLGTATITATTQDANKTATASIMVISYTWSGTTNTTWSSASNWLGGVVPPVGADISIPSGLSNYPVLGTSVTIGNCSIQSGGLLSLNGNALTIKGTIGGMGL